MRRAPLYLLAFALAGCAHARTTEPRAPAASTQPHAPAGVPVGPTPSSVLEPGAPKKIQKALAQKGYAVRATGRVDDDTRKALERFQRDEKMAATGLPDLETLRQLGLDPKDLYRQK